jgi:membrane fusion protein, multidrug efflux system
MASTVKRLAAKANFHKEQSDLDREEPLVTVHAFSEQDVEAARSTRDVDLAEMTLANLQVDYATIRAPADGCVGRKNVKVGNRLSLGETLMVIVEPDVWVVANIRAGESAVVKVSLTNPEEKAGTLTAK